MRIASVAERAFEQKYWMARETNRWTIRREQAEQHLQAAKALGHRSKDLDIQPYKKQYQTARAVQVNAMNAELTGARGELSNILSAALGEQPGIDLTNLKATVEVGQAISPWLTTPIPKPEWEHYEPRQTLGHLYRLPGFRQLDARRARAAHAEWQEAVDEWEKAERERKRRLAGEETKAEAARIKAAAAVNAKNAQLDAFRQRVSAGEADAVQEYFSAVLESLAWPAKFPRHHTVSYRGATSHLNVEMALPAVRIVPTVQSYSYDEAQDRIVSAPNEQAEVDGLHRSVLAQATLRVLRELFGSDEFGLIQTLTLHAVTETVDDATGRAIEPIVVSVETDVCRFRSLRLDHVDPVTCLDTLTGRLADVVRPPDPQWIGSSYS